MIGEGSGSVEEEVLEGFEESRREDLRLEDIGRGLVYVDPVTAATDLAAFVVGYVPVLAAQHLDLYVLGLSQRLAPLLLVLI